MLWATIDPAYMSGLPNIERVHKSPSNENDFRQAKEAQWPSTQKIYEIVTSKNPLKLKFEFALGLEIWSAISSGANLGVNLRLVSLGRLLKKMGMSPLKQLHRASKQDPNLVQQWLEAKFPKIKAMARYSKADIHFGIEASVRSDFRSVTSWTRRGQPLVLKTTSA